MTANRKSVRITLIQRLSSDHAGQHVTKSGAPDGLDTVTSQRDQIDRDKNKFFRLFKGHIRNQDHELIAGWFELFFDLIYVACIMHLCIEVGISLSHKSHSYKSKGNYGYGHESHDPLCEHEWKYSYVLCAFSQFAIFTQTWRDNVLYMNQFVFTQEIDEVLRVLYMLFVLSMGIFISDSYYYHVGFQISYILLRFTDILMHVKVVMIPNAKWNGILQIATSTITIILIILLLSFKHLYEGCAMEFACIYFVLFLVDLCGHFEIQCHITTAIPINVDHIGERFGLFMLVILGEAIISVMTADVGALDLANLTFFATNGKPPDIALIVYILLNFLITYFIARLYYNGQPEEHALYSDKWHGKPLFSYIHQILFLALLGLGMGIKIAGKHLLGYHKYWIDVWLPGYSLVIIIICLMFIRISHPYHADHKLWIFRAFIIMIMAIMPVFAMEMNQGVIFMILFVCVIMLVATDVEGRETRKEIKNGGHHDTNPESSHDGDESAQQSEEYEDSSEYAYESSTYGTYSTLRNW